MFGHVKNKQPNPVQLTSEQILAEANDFVEERAVPARRKIVDVEELREHQLQKRTAFENTLRRYPHRVGEWCKYGRWEAAQGEYARARSVFERALKVDYRNPAVWTAYAETEMRGKFVASARNVWDRAVALLPRVDKLWFKYAHMEEVLGETDAARRVFERWSEWQPVAAAWASFAKFEARHGTPGLVRGVYERWLVAHCEPDTYLRYARWEERQGRPDLARAVYERAAEELDDKTSRAGVLESFAQFEERQKEFERVRAIYRFALDSLARDEVARVYPAYAAFEKRHGSGRGIEEAVLARRRFQYEDEVAADSHNYDVWFDYVRLEEAAARSELRRGQQQREDDDPHRRVRAVYHRAVAAVPPVLEKRYWRRYIYLWIGLATYEEVAARDAARARDAWRECLRVVPHETFTFAKVWLMAAELEVRSGDLAAARRLLGTALGRCPKERLFRGYLELELGLGEVERCRRLYEKYVGFAPDSAQAWRRFASLERSLRETERARGIYELAVAQDDLDAPEAVWKAYIDFETGLGELQRVRELYRRLLGRTRHVNVWIARARFEARHSEGAAAARAVFEEAEAHFREGEPDNKEARAALLEAWRDFEANLGTPDDLARVEARMPRRVKKRRLLRNERGEDDGWEEYWDFVFPEDERKRSAMAILERARKWKEEQTRKKAEAEAAGGGGGVGGE